MAEGGVRPWIHERIDEWTSLEGDRRATPGCLWTSDGRLVADARKDKHEGITPEAVRAELDRLKEADEVMHWCGLLAPVDVEHLRAIIEREVTASITRRLLVKRANRLMQQARAEEEEVAAADA